MLSNCSFPCLPIAHPERSLGLGADFGIARALVEQGCLLCPNGDSALGVNGPLAEQAFWRLPDEGLVALVASDGHSRQRPPRLDQAHRVLVERYGEASIEVLFNGSAHALDLLAQRDQRQRGSVSAFRHERHGPVSNTRAR